MHPTANRLLEAFKEKHGPTKTRAEMARTLGVSQQTLDHWDERGVSKAGILTAEKLLGVNADWLRTGEGQKHPPPMGVAQVLILDKSTVEPLLLTWELLMQSDVLPPDFVVALPDGALGPDTPAGALVYFRTSPLKAEVGDGILVEDAAGVRYIRRMAQGPGGTWIAEASARGYASLRSDTDGLKLLAVAYDVRRGSGKV